MCNNRLHFIRLGEKNQIIEFQLSKEIQPEGILFCRTGLFLVWCFRLDYISERCPQFCRRRQQRHIYSRITQIISGLSIGGRASLLLTYRGLWHPHQTTNICKHRCYLRLVHCIRLEISDDHLFIVDYCNTYMTSVCIVVAVICFDPFT